MNAHAFPSMTDAAFAARAFNAAKSAIRRALEYRAQAKGRPKKGNGTRRTCRALARVATADACGSLSAALAWRDGAHTDQACHSWRVEAIAADANRVACAAEKRMTDG